MLKNKAFNIQKWTLGIVYTLYWVFAFLFFYIFYGREGQSLYSSLAFSLSFTFVSFACVDMHARFITKPNLYKKKYHRIILFSIYVFIAAFWLESVLSFVLNIYFWDFEGGRILEDANRIRYQVGGVNMMVFGGVAIQFMAETFRLHQQKEKKEKLAVESSLKLKEAELNVLRSQVNPHFLFNSLNSIYGLSLEKSEQTPAVIMQLSEILDYMLYKCNDQVLISEEIRQVENYLGIQQVRFGNSLKIESEFFFDKDQQIAPLLLFPLIENAFKHGEISADFPVIISIVLQQDRLNVEIENECKKKRNAVAVPGGIGLNNLRRRLELLYSGCFEMHVMKNKDRFSVNLMLKLAKK